MKRLAMFVLMLISTAAIASEALIEHAAKLTGYEIPDTRPAIKHVTREWMGNRACPRNPEGCNVFGLYDDQDVIYIRDDLPPAIEEHVTLHELVHWLQHHSGKYSLFKCTDTVMREREAYQAQNTYIILVQNGPMFSPLPPLWCPEE